MNIIIFGKIGSGKDTVAEIISKRLNSKIIKLGKKIREDIDNIFDMLPETDKRSMYQKYGQGLRALINEDIWNITTFKSIMKDLEKDEKFIVADARQLNEFHFWKEKGFFPVAVVADSEARKNRVKDRDGYEQHGNFEHETEKSAEKITEMIRELESKGQAYIVENDGTLKDLEDKIGYLCDNLLS